MGVLSRIDDFKYISNPYELQEYMDHNIIYGYIDNNFVMHRNSTKDILEKYKTRDLSLTVAYGIGTCIEQAKLIGYVYSRLGYEVHYYCSFSAPEDQLIQGGRVRIHCFTLAVKDDRVIYQEQVNIKRKGIYYFFHIDDALEVIKNSYEGNEDYKIYEIDDIPEGLDIYEFIDYVKTSKKVYKK